MILKVLSNEINDFDREYGDFEGAVDAISNESTMILKGLSNEMSCFDRQNYDFEGAVE